MTGAGRMYQRSRGDDVGGHEIGLILSVVPWVTLQFGSAPDARIIASCGRFARHAWVLRSAKSAGLRMTTWGTEHGAEHTGRLMTYFGGGKRHTTVTTSATAIPSDTSTKR